MIANDWIKETVILHDHINNYLSKSVTIDGNFNWLVVDYFDQAIDNYKNRVVVIAFLVVGHLKNL